MSVIVPVYNVEEWLPTCLESVANQLLTDWECIVVIDGSPDRSEQIAREYSARDSRFRVFSVPNAGLGAARNTGLLHATGEWVFFLDSDDEIPSNALSALRDEAVSAEADIVAGVGIDFYPDGREVTYWTQRGRLFESRGTNLTVARDPEVLFDHVAWNKLYRRSLLTEHAIQFSVGVHCEDMRFAARSALAARSLAVVPTVVYRHRRHEAAISADYLREKTLRDWVSESCGTIEYLRAHTTERALQVYIENFIKRQWWTRIADLGRIHDLALIREIERLTQTVWEASSSAVRSKLPALCSAWFEFIASGLLQQRLVEGDRLHYPLPSANDDPRCVVESVAGIIDALDLRSEIECRLAAALVVERACRVLRQSELEAEEFDSIVRRLAALSSRVPTALLRDLAPETVLDESLGGSEIIDRVLSRLEILHAALTEVSLSSGSLTLRGRIKLGLPRPEVKSLSIVMRSMTSRRVRAFPMWWKLADIDNELTWSIPVALTADLLDQHWKCWVRIEREGTPARDILLENVMHDAAIDAISSRRDDGKEELRVFFPRSRAAVWCVSADAGAAIPRRAGVSGVTTRPRGVFTFPDWRSNPYLSMLHMEALAAGRQMRGSTRLSDLIDELKRPARNSDIVHIHWTSPVTEVAESESAAIANMNALLAAVRSAVASGRIVVWTIHNAIPHDTQYPAVARSLNAGLAAAVSAIHVLSTTSMSVLETQFPLDHAKVAVIPHSSYYGVYGARVARAEARRRIGADPSLPSVLFFGQVRPYKGVEHLVDAIETLDSESEPLQLLVAGKVAPEAAPIVDRIEHLHIPVAASFDFIPDDDVSTWFSAADIAVLPYRDILNSGTMLLAATFGVPCLVPGLVHLREQFGGEAWVSYFDPNDPARSIAAAIREKDYLRDAARDSARDFARRYTPIHMAREYANLLDRLDASGAEVSVPVRRGFRRA